MKKRIIIYIAILAVLYVIGCTENPFFKDKNITGNTLSGTVKLSNESDSHQNIYVWLEGFNTSVFTDDNGFFNLDIASSSQLGINQSGNYKLYFYVNNYYLDSAKIVIVNNNIQYGEGDLDDKGILKTTRNLSKLLDIDVEMNQEIFQTDFEDSIKFFITLDAVKDTVTIQTQIFSPFNPFDLTAGIIKKIESPGKNILINKGGVIFKEIPIPPEYLNPDFKRSFRIAIKYDADMFPPGEYQFIPYIMVSYPETIRIRYPKAPSALINSLDAEIDKPDTSFLNIPLEIDGGEFVVIKK